MTYLRPLQPYNLYDWWRALPDRRIMFTQMWTYFTVWVLLITGIGLMMPSHRLFAMTHKVMAVQASCGGLYLTYVHPRRLIVHYCRVDLDGPCLQILDILSHHIPLVLAYRHHPIYSPPSPTERLLTMLPLLGYLSLFSVEEKYTLRRNDLQCLIYPILFACCIVWMDEPLSFLLRWISNP